MDEAELAAKIDHTVLGPETTVADVKRVLDEAAEYGTNACIPPCYVAEAAEYADSAVDTASTERTEGHAPDVTLVTVVGFPHGQNATAVKREEAVRAYEDGADEVDMVVNVGRLKAGEQEVVREDVEEVVAAVPVPVKVIVETALLSDDEKRRACEAAKEADAAFVKTSTGFASVPSERADGEAASGGATVEDVELMSEYLPVKASGGVGDYGTAKAMLDAGAERIGASSGVEIVEDFRRNYQ